MNATDESITLARQAAHAASDKLAEDIVALDVSDRLAITDVFVIASASSERQVNAIVDGVEEQLLKHGLKPVRREGRSEGRWVLLDYAEIVVHVQHEEDRVFYALERLWGDCPAVDLQLPERDSNSGIGDTGGTGRTEQTDDAAAAGSDSGTDPAG
ncbi:ribosome silencing factor [Arthrobacter castelli]|uniref:ribosome silencing factor n=1 Tax=Arthrobacter castelli TaxID=271431 RepID=UPI00042595E9|nr:ribosome silencing factor [Arthrobacter castelli]